MPAIKNRRMFKQTPVVLPARRVDMTVGSKDWALSTVEVAKHLWQSREVTEERWQTIVDELKQGRAWEPLGVKSLDELLKKAIGHTAAESIAVLGRQGEFGKGRPKDRGTNIPLRGGNPIYGRARLDRDRPDLAAEVRAGRLKLGEAMIQAGFRRKTISISLSVELVAKALRKHFTASQLDELKKLL